MDMHGVSDSGVAICQKPASVTCPWPPAAAAAAWDELLLSLAGALNNSAFEPRQAGSGSGDSSRDGVTCEVASERSTASSGTTHSTTSSALPQCSLEATDHSLDLPPLELLFQEQHHEQDQEQFQALAQIQQQQAAAAALGLSQLSSCGGMERFPAGSSPQAGVGPACSLPLPSLSNVSSGWLAQALPGPLPASPLETVPLLPSLQPFSQVLGLCQAGTAQLQQQQQQQHAWSAAAAATLQQQHQQEHVLQPGGCAVCGSTLQAPLAAASVRRLPEQQLPCQAQQPHTSCQFASGASVQCVIGWPCIPPGQAPQAPFPKMQQQSAAYLAHQVAQADQDPPEALVGIDGRYQPYCQQLISSRLNEAALSVLNILKVLQATDPGTAPTQPQSSPAANNKRFFCSLKEVSKVSCTAGCIIVAPDVRCSPTAHVNPVRMLQRILGSARRAGVPVIFALSRRGIGQVFGRDKSMSIVAIMHLDGLEAEFGVMLEESIKGRQLYLQHRANPPYVSPRSAAATGGSMRGRQAARGALPTAQ